MKWGLRGACIMGSLLVVGCSSETDASDASDSRFVMRASPFKAPMAGTQGTCHVDQGCIGAAAKYDFKVYSLHVSKNADCSDPIEVGNHGSAGTMFDIADSPVMFETESLEPGEYPCVTFVFSDIAQFEPDAEMASAHAACEAGVSYPKQFCREGDSQVDLDGNTHPCQGTDADFVDEVIYARGSTSPPQLPWAGPMDSPLIVPGQTTVYFDTQGAGFEEDGQCKLGGVEAGFR
jgi:hypothetical protein